MTKQRIDILLVKRGLVESQAKAQAMVMAGEVVVEGTAVTQAGTLVNEEAAITIVAPPPFVSRGGIKLAYALDQLQLDVSDKVAADIGASTGGFTDCLLQRGARRVYAIDVGRGQLDYRLRQDPRVVVVEGANARYSLALPERVDLATIDVSFISVEKVIPPVAQLVKDGGYLVVLIKPQFEARRREVGKGGIIRVPLIHARVLGRFVAWLTGQNLRLGGLLSSPLLGASGNREFFVVLRLETK
ncbi:MAG TPA: TlyA family RNA methyltransferase [Dehalococcoidales bacterium]